MRNYFIAFQSVIFFFVIVLSLLSYACTSIEDDNVTTIELATTPDTMKVENMALNLDNTLINKYIVISDSIVILVNSPKAGNFIDIYDQISGTIIKSYFDVGEGPDEMLFCDIFSDGHEIVATDYIRNRFSQFNIDSLIYTSFNPEFITYPYSIGVTSHPIKFNDSIILVNPFSYINKQARINQNLPRLLKVKVNQQEFADLAAPSLYTQNVSQAKILYNKYTNEIWEFPYGKSEIAIYDVTLNKKKTIRINTEVADDANVYIKDISTGKKVLYKDGYPLAFTNIAISPDNKSIFICLVGRLITKNMQESDCAVYLLKMNWDGKILDSYYVPNFIYSLSVKESGIYATIDDNEENRILVKLSPSHE